MIPQRHQGENPNRKMVCCCEGAPPTQSHAFPPWPPSRAHTRARARIMQAHHARAALGLPLPYGEGPPMAGPCSAATGPLRGHAGHARACVRVGMRGHACRHGAQGRGHLSLAPSLPRVACYHMLPGCAIGVSTIVPAPQCRYILGCRWFNVAALRGTLLDPSIVGPYMQKQR